LWQVAAKELAYLNDVSSVPLQQALRHLQTAFTHFFAKRANYPRFKSKKKSRKSAEYTRSAFRFQDGRLRPAKMAEPLEIVWSRPLPEGARPSTVTVSQDAADRWFPSSRLCSHCGAKRHTMPPHLRTWTCECGMTHDRDVNAANNLLAAGLAVSACGAGVRTQRNTPGGQSATKQEPPRREP
jgi:putative transposase